MISVANRLVENVEDIFGYEQCGYPAALLNAIGFLREANKAPVLCEDESASITYILDGGSLLQKLP